MTQTSHDEAQVLIATGNVLTTAEQAWLRNHLEECAECREYVEACNRVGAALRAVPVTADARLVRATQMRVRFHANRMREVRARMWMVGVACMGVGLSAAVTAPLLWRLFAWMGARAGVSDTVWQAAYGGFWIAPVLVVSVLLLARGTHLADHRD